MLLAGVAIPAVGGAGVGLVAAAEEVDLRPADLVEPPAPSGRTRWRAR
ncbi:MAG TPA: hypothetical protein VFV66_12005 [Nonomuraea sp.]|nr:hypothetical protein [Nonomuraea sp.]